MSRFRLFTLSILSLISCAPGYEKIERAEMLDIMSDLMIVEQVVRNYDVRSQDSIRDVLKESLLKVHNVTEQQLDTNLYLYQFNTESFKSFTVDLVKLLEQKREEDYDSKNYKVKINE